MVRAGRVAFVAGGLIVKAGSAFVGLTIAVGLIVPLPDPSDRGSTGSGERTSSGSRIVLNIPEGELSETITLVDATGRALANVTHFRNGDLFMLGRGRKRTRVSCFLNDTQGSVHLEVRQSLRQAQIDVQSDATTSTKVSDRPDIDTVAASAISSE